MYFLHYNRHETTDFNAVIKDQVLKQNSQLLFPNGPLLQEYFPQLFGATNKVMKALNNLKDEKV